jgi:hypothetical protein
MSNDDSTSVLRKGPGVPWCGTGPIEKAATEKVAAAAVEAAEQAAAMQAASIAEGAIVILAIGTSGKTLLFCFLKCRRNNTPGACNPDSDLESPSLLPSCCFWGEVP